MCVGVLHCNLLSRAYAACVRLRAAAGDAVFARPVLSGACCCAWLYLMESSAAAKPWDKYRAKKGKQEWGWLEGGFGDVHTFQCRFRV